MADLGNFIPGAPVRFGIVEDVFGGLRHPSRPLRRPSGSANRRFMAMVLSFTEETVFPTLHSSIRDVEQISRAMHDRCSCFARDQLTFHLLSH